MSAERTDSASLGAKVPTTPTSDADDILERFLAWVAEIGIEPYEAQEEAFLEVMGGRHVILNTPTGSGKSLVALSMHFKAVCEGKRAFYTSPIKALVSEKFFDLCRSLGAERVGMMTGDASINPTAPIICCTAEVLSNLALRDGESADVHYVVMDEFHYFSDAERGIAWQLPLITLPHVQFLLMSATLGDVGVFEQRIPEYTGRELVVVKSATRPVPLDFAYRETTIHDTVTTLGDDGRTPIYVVNFSQREAAEQAQNMMSVNLCSKEEKRAITAEIGDFRFDTVYGKDVQRFVKHGIGVHHAGLLPKYRTLVERLAQRGHLKLISGTDTLGVGVNVPIRTVVFSKLCKFDGEKVGILSVRDFKQIAGRAGRKGFDDAGSVIAQAPEHVVENKKLEAKALMAKKKKFTRKKPPERGYVPWDEKTLEKLRTSEPEPLVSSMHLSHGLLLTVLQRDAGDYDAPGGYARLLEIIDRSYEREGRRERLRQEAAQLFEDLENAGIVEVLERTDAGPRVVQVAEGLQRDFSLHQTLSLFLLEALEALDPDAETYPLDVVSMVESILENPFAVLKQQVATAKTELVAKLKAEGVEYEQRMEALEKVDFPKPCANFIYGVYDRFRTTHPWLRGENVRPKSIVRDMYERFASFNEYVKQYGLGRSEGVLLRYLSQAYKVLLQTVPETYRDDRVEEIIAYLRATLARADSSLVREWEAMMGKPAAPDPELPEVELPPPDPAADPKSFRARLRAEMQSLVKALAAGDFEEAALSSRSTEPAWTSDRFEEALAPCLEEIGSLVFDHRARMSHLTHVDAVSERIWVVQQTLCNEDGDTMWMVEAQVDLPVPTHDAPVPDGPLIALTRVGC
ncbi:MAG: DUF3516 domain-containing protein [Myxococcota bacterium]